MDMREQSRGSAKTYGTDDAEVADRSTGKAAKVPDSSFSGGRSLREVTLSEPIRYSKGDGVEKWLNTVLCLDATLPR
jgi:N-acetyltransferase 10